MIDQSERLKALADREWAAPRPRMTGGNCRVLAVTSGKGGVGKSSLTLNLALVLARMGRRVMIIDADLGLANIDVLLNIIPRYTLEDVISGARELKEIVVEGPLGLKIIPGGSGLFEMANLDLAKRNLLLERLRALEDEAEILLLDTSAGLSRTGVGFIGAAQEFIVVTTPEPTALTDAYATIKVIAEFGLPQKGHLIVNCIRQMRQGEQVFERLQKVIRRYLPTMSINYLGGVKFDPAVSEAVHSFTPFVLANPRGAAASSISRIALRLLFAGEEQAKLKQGTPGFIERLKILINLPEG